MTRPDNGGYESVRNPQGCTCGEAWRGHPEPHAATCPLFNDSRPDYRTEVANWQRWSWVALYRGTTVATGESARELLEALQAMRITGAIIEAVRCG